MTHRIAYPAPAGPFAVHATLLLALLLGSPALAGCPQTLEDESNQALDLLDEKLAADADFDDGQAAELADPPNLRKAIEHYASAADQYATVLKKALDRRDGSQHADTRAVFGDIVHDAGAGRLLALDRIAQAQVSIGDDPTKTIKAGRDAARQASELGVLETGGLEYSLGTYCYLEAAYTFDTGGDPRNLVYECFNYFETAASGPAQPQLLYLGASAAAALMSDYCVARIDAGDADDSVRADYCHALDAEAEYLVWAYEAEATEDWITDAAKARWALADYLLYEGSPHYSVSATLLHVVAHCDEWEGWVDVNDRAAVNEVCYIRGNAALSLARIGVRAAANDPTLNDRSPFDGDVGLMAAVAIADLGACADYLYFDEWTVRYNLGVAHLLRGDRDAARRCYEFALELAEGDPNAVAAVQAAIDQLGD